MLLILAASVAAAVHRTPRAAAGVAKRHVLFPHFDRAVPVLLYHWLSASSNGYGVAPADFAAEMQRLHDLGFQAISLDDYVRFVRGEPVDLPPRPILITFDDGYVSSYEVADPILAQYGWTAAMYIPTGFIGDHGRLSWAQLRQMQASGRWDIDEHAGNGHVLVDAGATGRRLPFYASEIWTNGRRESFAHYKRRVSDDIELGLATLAKNIPGWTPYGTFAVPFNDYGQHGSNDPRIEPWLSGFLKAHFAAIFVQDGDGFSTPGAGFENRIPVPGAWGPDTLETHLRTGAQLLAHAH